MTGTAECRKLHYPLLAPERKLCELELDPILLLAASLTSHLVMARNVREEPQVYCIHGFYFDCATLCRCDVCGKLGLSC